MAAVIQRDGKYMIARRGPGKHLAGYWEFPGGKVENGETPEESMTREIREEFDVEAKVEGYIGESVHDYGTKVVRLMAYRVVVEDEIRESTDHDLIEWVELNQMTNYQLAPADIPLLGYLN